MGYFVFTFQRISCNITKLLQYAYEMIELLLKIMYHIANVEN